MAGVWQLSAFFPITFIAPAWRHHLVGRELETVGGKPPLNPCRGFRFRYVGPAHQPFDNSGEMTPERRIEPASWAGVVSASLPGPQHRMRSAALPRACELLGYCVR